MVPINLNIIKKMKQKQKQLSKQSQLVDQNFSNGIMLNCISALENLAIFYGYKGKRIFDYYSGYANRNNENELINAVIIQLEVFRASHSNYSMVYSNYDFPKNLSKEQIVKIINDWKKVIPHKNVIIFYDEILRYLGGYSDTSGISETLNMRQKEWGPTTKKDLERIARDAPYINSTMFRQMDEVKNSYQKTGNYEINAHLNKNQGDDIDMRDLNSYEQKFNEKLDKFIITEQKIESVFETLPSKINCNLLQKSDIQYLSQLVEAFKTLIVGINFQENEIKKKIEFYQMFKIKISKLTNDQNILNLFNNICDTIIKCYNKNNPYGMS